MYISYVGPEFLHYSEVAMKYSALTLFSALYVIVWCEYAKIWARYQATTVYIAVCLCMFYVCLQKSSPPPVSKTIAFHTKFKSDVK